jgi:hypothetical protein
MQILNHHICKKDLMKNILIFFVACSLSMTVFSQKIDVHFSPVENAVRQYELMGVHDGVLYARGMGANIHKFDVKTGAKISKGVFVDSKSKGRYFSADNLQVIMVPDGFYTVYFKKSGSNYQMMMGKYDFNEQAIIEDKLIDGDLANTSYYSIEENFVHLEYANDKVYVCLNNLDGDDKTICAYVLDKELNLLGNVRLPVPASKKDQSFDKIVITDEGDMWLVRDLKKYDKTTLFFFDKNYTKIHSGADNLEFYHFYLKNGGLKADNFQYSGRPNYHSVNLYTYANNLVMGNSHASLPSEKGFYVWLNKENHSDDNEIEFAPSEETKTLTGTENLNLYYILVGTTQSGNNIFAASGTAGEKKCGFIEEYSKDGKRRIFKSTYRDFGYDNNNTYVHVNRDGNYVLCLTSMKNYLQAIKIDLGSGEETVVELPDLPYTPYLSCRLTASGNYYSGYWFTDNLATTGGVFIVEVK